MVSGIENIIFGIEAVVSWPAIMFLIFGVIIGIVVGALPGLGAPLGMAILLPLTTGMEPLHAIILLVSVYSGAMYGGGIASILFNVPGTGSAVATTLDGYPMTKQGKALTALAISATSSAIGGFLTVILLFMLAPVMIELVLLFGSPEFFLMAILGLAMISVIAQGSLMKGITAGTFGLLLTTIGIAPMSPESRFTFGMISLYDGIGFIPALLGLFAIGEIIALAGRSGSIAQQSIEVSGSILDGVRIALSNGITLIKSALLGLGIGAIPGAGAVVSTLIAYAEAERSSGNSDEFGEGRAEGVIAAEASNNGTIGGSLIPTLSFGIPGSPATAVLLGGLILHGLIPGPELFADNIHVPYAIFSALFVGNVIILLFGLTVVTQAEVLTRIDSDYIIPVIIVLSMAGALSMNYNWFDVATVLLLGILGYFMKKHDYSIVSFTLGVILGPIAEENLHRSMQLSSGDLSIFISEPLSLLLVISIILILFGSNLRSLIEDTIERLPYKRAG